MWATSLTREARRWTHLLVRLLTYTAAASLAALLGFGLWSVVALVITDGEGFLTVLGLIGVVWKTALISLAWTSLGIGFVAVFRSLGPALGAGLALAFLEGFLGFWRPWENVSISGASNGLFDVDLSGVFGALIDGQALPLWHKLAILAGWTVLGLGLAWWGLYRRDA